MANGFRKALPIEDPARLGRFLCRVMEQGWTDKEARLRGLQLVADESVLLIRAEVDYYYKTRKRAMHLSGWFRLFGFIFGGLGVLAPTLATVFPEQKWLLSVGYTFLVGATVTFGGNELFGGTSRHIRYVIAQYALEELLAQFVLRWSRFMAGRESASLDDAALKDGFDLIEALVHDAHELIRNETSEWATRTTEALNAYVAGIKEAGKRSGTTDRPKQP